MLVSFMTNEQNLLCAVRSKIKFSRMDDDMKVHLPTASKTDIILGNAGAEQPVRLVRLWPDHFFAYCNER